MTLRKTGLFFATLWLAAARASADLAEFKTRGSLRVLVDVNEEPEFFVRSTNGPDGIYGDVIESFAKSQGLRLEVVPVERFELMIPALIDGKGDVITGMVDTAKRRALVDFTAEALPSRHVVVTRSPNPTIVDVGRLQVTRVGVIGGTSWAEAAADAGVPAALMLSFDSTATTLGALRDGKVSAVVMTVTEFALARRRDERLQAGMFLGQAGSVAWGVRKSDPALRRALSGHIKALKNSPRWNTLVQQYFGTEFLQLLGRARRD